MLKLLGIALVALGFALRWNTLLVVVVGLLERHGLQQHVASLMAANFNLVPVRLLELRDDYAVIRAQVPFAAAIWIFNLVLMALTVYRVGPDNR